jgi:hypothetical protein
VDGEFRPCDAHLVKLLAEVDGEPCRACRSQRPAGRPGGSTRWRGWRSGSPLSESNFLTAFVRPTLSSRI